MRQESGKDFFISYNRADITWAEWIAWELEAAGYTTILQAWDFRPGFNFAVRMEQALKEADRVIAILSPEYLAAEFTRSEWVEGFGQDPQSGKGLLLPIRIKEGNLKGLLRQIAYIDLVGLEEQEARRALLEGVKTERAKPSLKPGFPGASHHEAQPSVFPGSLPAAWNVPHQRNPYFLGRESLLDGIHAALNSGGARQRRQVIYGRGGLGKTQVAIEYAYRHADEYDLVWWMRSEEPSALAADYAGMYRKLRLLPTDTNDQGYMNDAARRALEGRDRWLLIFDNATRPEDLLDYLPRAGGGHVLITSRADGWGAADAVEREIEPLSADDAVDLLLKKTG